MIQRYLARGNGKSGAFVHVFAATLDRRESLVFADRAAQLMRAVVAALEGFVHGRIVEAPDGKSVIVLTCWKTRPLWAKAGWHRRIEGLLAETSVSGARFVVQRFTKVST
jgi:hypothetical protein